LTRGRLIGIGIGPGAPGRITLEAVEVIRKADVICTPRSENKEESIAYEIIKRWCTGKRIVAMPYSMAPDHKAREKSWQDHAQTIASSCSEGELVAFVTLGDPGLYSTFAYVAKLVRGIDSQIPVAIVPGVTSVSACAAAIGQSLAQAEETLTIQPCSQVLAKRGVWWRNFDCVVVMKIGRKLPDLVKHLHRLSLLEHTTLVTRAGFGTGTITSGSDLLTCDAQNGYLATMFVRAGVNNETGAKK
jgi:precorrin-2/cobalt-factor-2 C20-methyltransferase